MPKATGFGAHTLNPKPKRDRSLMPSWTQALDRWGPVPRGYGLLRCGCRVTRLDGSDGGPQEWVLPMNPPPEHLRRAPVPSALVEGDTCPLGCGQPIGRGSEGTRGPEPKDPAEITAMVEAAKASRMPPDPRPRPARFTPGTTMWEEAARVAAARRQRPVQ